MSISYSLPYRQVHLDFHTGPAIPDVGRDFDPAAFARTMQDARVGSVTLFAKCHHGHLYYDTDRPERHPGLPRDLDLLRLQVDALHGAGIRAPIYISIQCDEYAANAHPEWVARNPDSTQVKWARDVFQPGWQILDMSSPYQEFLAEQTAEVLAKFHPVDGIFFDMCWDQPSTTKYAIEGMRREGLAPESEKDRAKYAREVAIDYMRRFYGMVKESSPDATVYFNSRPFFNLAEDIEFLEQVEIEALPTGGWGYMYFPKNVRFARTFPKPYMGMTARFHKSWADFGGLKPYAALEYETSQIVAHGARCSIGDQLHPRGVLDPGAYDLIGRAYARIEEREPWLIDAVAVSQIGLFQLPTGETRTTQSTSGTDEGATRMLTQLGHQFDVVSEASDLSPYELLVLPDAVPTGPNLREKMRDYLSVGGALLLTGTSGMSADGTEVLLSEMGVTAEGFSPYSVTYLRFGEEINADVPPSDHVMYERGVRVRPVEGANPVAGVVEPYFERAWDHFCSHNQTPGDRLSPYAGAVLNGKVATIPFPVFAAYATHGNFPLRLLVRNVIDLLLPEQILRVDGPTGLETTVMRQAGKGAAGGDRVIVHLLYYAAERRARNLDLIEDIVPLYDVPLSLRLDREPSSVSLAPEGEPVEFQWANGWVEATIPEVRGHAMVVFE